MDSLIAVRGLGFAPPGKDRQILHNVQLTLAPGEIVLVAGPTGSGKSTLINAVAGVIPAHTGGCLEGEVSFAGRSLLPLSVRERARHIGTVLQNVEVQIFTDRVREEVAFGLENLNVSPERIAAQMGELLAEFGLQSQRDWPIARLSAGQKQRLVLACVLAMDQPVLLLDEPFAYLDRAGAQLLLELLVRRAHGGQAILLVEHRLDLVAAVAHRSYCCAEGTLRPGLPQGVEATTAPVRPAAGPVVLESRILAYGGYPPLPDLTVRAGETVLLKGDNGCGKTTLLKLLCGLLRPAGGSLTILGKDALKQSVAERSRTLGFVLQNPNHQLFADSVAGEVAQPGVAPEFAEQLLEQLNLLPEREQHPQSLSQGQKRRLALAAVLARRPRICLLDEITVGQDPRSLSLMLDALEAFTGKGGALILTSHDPQAASRLGARVVAL